MGSLQSVSPVTQERDVSNRQNIEGVLENPATVSRAFVATEIQEQAATKATITYVDNQDALFAPSTYPATQDALLVPTASKGQANGVASLESGAVPVAQLPNVGVGVIKGPFGFSNPAGGTVSGATRLRIADFVLPGGGLSTINGHIWAFMTVVVAAVDSSARPCVEVRYSTTGDTTYAGQTLIAQGLGRSYYNDFQTITVMPVMATDGGTQTAIGAAQTLTISAWAYDIANAGGQISHTVGHIYSGAVYLVRTAL